MKKQQGFTMIELMATISIAAILSTVGIPSFSAMIEKNRAVVDANNWHAALTYARSEAIKRNQQVTICQSTIGTICTAAANWQTGWIMFVDGDRNGAYSSGEEIIKIQSAKPSDAVLVRVGSTDNYIAYTSNGNAETTDGVPVNTDWMLCLNNHMDDNTRVISVSNSGKAKVGKNNRANSGPSENSAHTTCI